MVPNRYTHIILEYTYIGNLSIGEVKAHAERVNATAPVNVQIAGGLGVNQKGVLEWCSRVRLLTD